MDDEEYRSWLGLIVFAVVFFHIMRDVYGPQDRKKP